MKIVILASGRGSNACALLEAEKSGRLGGAEIVAVISDKQNAPVLEIAKKFGKKSEYLSASSDGAYFGEGGAERYISRIRELGGELIVLAGFMRILPEFFIDAFPEAIVNLHPSLLPAFKGRDAIKRAYEYGVKICGCTVHMVNAKVDGGKILAQKAVEILDGETLDDLEARIHNAEHILLTETVAKIAMQKNLK